jgi:DNA-binding HxlR family transcriptional regulator
VRGRYEIRTGTTPAPDYLRYMKSYGQFCSIARALDLLGERWTVLIVRELLCGSTRFSEIRRGIPRISRTMLSARLHELLDAGIIVPDGSEGTAYRLTPAGAQLSGVVGELGAWGQKWLSRELPRHDLDLDVLAFDMRRRVNLAALPEVPIVVRVEAVDTARNTAVRYLLLRRSEVSLCSANPGFPNELSVRGPLAILTAWWRGDLSLSAARASGMIVEGRREWVQAFPDWFQRYAFAHIEPVNQQNVTSSRTSR